MSENGLPEGYASARVSGALVVAREAALDAVVRAVERHGSLHAWAASRAEAKALAGRGTAWAVDAPPGASAPPGESSPPGASWAPGASAPPAPPEASPRWVVRHYRRGGAVARWLGDRYLRLGAPRPLGELRASAAARTRGVRTPEVVALSIHPAGVFYRADLATAEVPGAVDLAESLWAERPSASDPATRVAALTGAGGLLRELAAAGVRHRDLNAKNILIAEADAGADDVAAPPVVAWVLDLDGCRVGEPLTWKERREAQARLERSLRKWERLTRRPLAPAEWAALREALERPAPLAETSHD